MTRVDPNIVTRLRRAALYAGSIAIAISVLALIGWTFHVNVLKGEFRDSPFPMNPMSAVCFILAGIALRLQLRETSTLHRRLAEVRPRAPRPDLASG